MAHKDKESRAPFADSLRRLLGSTCILLAMLAWVTPSHAADSAAANSALLSGYLAAVNAHNVAAFKDVIAESYLQHNGRSVQGLAGLEAIYTQYFRTFTDFHMT